MIKFAKRDEVRLTSGRVIVTDPIVTRDGTPEEIEFAARIARAFGKRANADFIVVYAYDRLQSIVAGNLCAVFVDQIESITTRDVQIDGPKV